MWCSNRRGNSLTINGRRQCFRVTETSQTPADLKAMSADEGGDASLMPTTNSEPNPITSDLSAPSTTGKRKRVQSHDEKSAQDHNSPAAQSQEKTKLAETLRNVVKILSKYAFRFDFSNSSSLFDTNRQNFFLLGTTRISNS